MRTLKLASAVVAGLAFASPAMAAGGAVKAPSVNWSFQGLFGTYDRGALQRGYQVYSEVCASCHSLELLSYRNLQSIGFTADQVKEIAAEFEVTDGPNDEGEMFERPALPSDPFVKPFPNEAAARASNNGAWPPDLSLMTKARASGINYVHALLGQGYEEQVSADVLKGIFESETEKRMKAYEAALEEYEKAIDAGRGADKPEQPKPVSSIEDLGIGDDLQFNAYFPGYAIAMAAPLSEDAVEFEDKTKATVDQMAKDVTTFLTWAAEPELEERKRMGIKVVLFLIVLTGLFYAIKRKVWADQH